MSSYNDAFMPNFSPLGLSRPTLGCPLPRFSTHPTRGLDNGPWIDGTFLHLPRETAELRRSVLRSFIASVTWWNNEPLTYPILENFVLLTGGHSYCGFCNRTCITSEETLQCVMDHLDYHPYHASGVLDQQYIPRLNNMVSTGVATGLLEGEVEQNSLGMNMEVLPQIRMRQHGSNPLAAQSREPHTKTIFDNLYLRPNANSSRVELQAVGQKNAPTPLLHFLTIPYVCAQRILYFARELEVFNTQSVFLARQGLHLVMLLNDFVIAQEGPNDEQRRERIKLGDELLALEVSMKKWGTTTKVQEEYEQRVSDIRRHHENFFKDRFYYKIASGDSMSRNFEELLDYDEKTIELEQWKPVEQNDAGNAVRCLDPVPHI